MNVGIITLQSGYNYGGSLQCEALQETLIGQGHDVSVVNYYPVLMKSPPFWKGWGIRGKGRLGRVKLRWYQLRYLKGYKEKYDSYKRAKLQLTDICHSIEEVCALCNDFDVLVVGSDQVWNLAYHNDPVYYLVYPSGFKGKRVSYAACCGNKVSHVPHWLKGSLLGLDAIAVRNSFTKEWVDEVTDGEVENVEIVADPTLLYEYDLPEANEEQRKDYILVYIIGKGDESFHKKVIQSAKNKYGDIPVILAMATGYKIQLFSWVDQKLWMLNPYDWINWIKNASFVYTDSFHGVLFSLKYQRDFVAYYIEAIRSPRLKTLGEDLAVSQRIIDVNIRGMDVNLSDEIAWEIVRGKIEALRISSLNYLSSEIC